MDVVQNSRISQLQYDLQASTTWPTFGDKRIRQWKSYALILVQIMAIGFILTSHLTKRSIPKFKCCIRDNTFKVNIGIVTIIFTYKLHTS